mgnify:CR=1 FL=1
MSFNKCIFVGNLTRDVEVRYTPSNTAVAQFGIAVNERWTDKTTGEKKESVSFLDCEAWGKTGENIAKYFGKGKPILVECKAVQDAWKDKTDGSNRSKIKFKVEAFEFVGGDRSDTPAPATTARPAARPAMTRSQQTAYEDVREDDIPF